MNLFKMIEETISTQSVEEILHRNLKRFYGYEDTAVISYEALCERFDKEPFNELNEKLIYFKENIIDIQSNFQRYKAVYECLSDQISKETYERMIAAKVFMNMDYVQQAFCEDVIYFSKNIFMFTEETYVDCGGFDGDTVLNFADYVKQIKHIYVFEAMQKPAELCRTRIERRELLEKTTIFQKAVYSENCSLSFSIGEGNGDSRISEGGNVEVSAVKIDDYIKEPVTFFKMDIEGSEKNALCGAQKIIKENTPKMAICIYHLKDDFWKIPELILSINPRYKFKIRQHDPASLSETVLYCIPDTMGSVTREDVYFNKESKDLISYKKDKIWFLRQLRSKNIELSKIQELETSKEWLSDQYDILSKHIQELELWNHQLEQGKNWLSEQNSNLNNRIQELEISKEWLNDQYDILTKRIQELELWNHQLEQGKNWLSEQNSNLNSRIQELVEWIQILEHEKERLTEQTNSLEK